MQSLPRRMSLAALVLVLLTACGEDAEPGYHELPQSQGAQYETVYIAAVQLPTDESDGYILLRNNWDGPADLGGWGIVGRDARRLQIPHSTFVEPLGELRIHFGGGTSDEDDLFLGVDAELAEDDRLRLVDAADDTVARFEYGR